MKVNMDSGRHHIKLPDYDAPEHTEAVARFKEALAVHGAKVFEVHPEFVAVCKAALDELGVRRTESNVFAAAVDALTDGDA